MVIVYKLSISPSWCTGVTSRMHNDLSLNRRSRSFSINMSLNAEGLSSSAQNEFSHSDNLGCLCYIGVPQYRASASLYLGGDGAGSASSRSSISSSSSSSLSSSWEIVMEGSDQHINQLWVSAVKNFSVSLSMCVCVCVLWCVVVCCTCCVVCVCV